MWYFGVFGGVRKAWGLGFIFIEFVFFRGSGAVLIFSLFGVDGSFLVFLGFFRSGVFFRYGCSF